MLGESEWTDHMSLAGVLKNLDPASRRFAKGGCGF